MRVVHTVGSDCAIGKMSVTLELDAAARARGLSSAFVATGQTGIAISGWGIAVDHVISDFVAGAAARLVEEGAYAGAAAVRRRPGRARASRVLGRDAGPAARLPARRAGALPPRGRDRDLRLPGHADPAADRAVATYESAAGWVRPARVRGDRANTRGLDDDARARGDRARGDETGLPVTDPVRFGGETLLDAVL